MRGQPTAPSSTSIARRTLLTISSWAGNHDGMGLGIEPVCRLRMSAYCLA
jgi:hypothetical protein